MESVYDDIDMKKPLGISLHDRRGYFVTPDGTGFSEKMKRELIKRRSLDFDVLTDTNETQNILSTTSIQHQHNGINAIMDPTELLQLPPAVMANRLRLIASSAYDSLKTASKNAGGSSSKFSGESLILWFLEKGVVRSAAHAMLLANVLNNHGCLQVYISKKDKKESGANEEDESSGNSSKKPLSRKDSSSMFKSAGDTRLPFGDTPDMIPLTLSSSSQAAGAGFNNNQDLATNKSPNELLSNEKVSKMRFQFTFMKGAGDSKSGIPPGTPVAPTPTSEATEYAKGIVRGTGAKAMGLTQFTSASVNPNLVTENDLEALSRELAEEEAALRSDTKVSDTISSHI